MIKTQNISDRAAETQSTKILRHPLRTSKTSVAAPIADTAVSPMLNLIRRSTGISKPARTQAAAANGAVKHAATQHSPMTSLYRYSSNKPITAETTQPARNNRNPLLLRAAEAIAESSVAKTT